MRMTRKVAVITGGSMGIGEAVAKLFLAEGASVVLSSRDVERVEAARERLGNKDRTAAFACDVTKREEITALLAFAVQRFGGIDIWVNNAGFGLVDAVARMDMAACRRMFDTNLFGLIDAMQVVIPRMREQGSGTIVNISSVAGHIAVPYMAAYGATKHAVNAITRAARLELRNTGVKVVNICPGYVSTEFSANAIRGKESRAVPSSVKRGITADRVARAVLRGYLGSKRELVVPWHNRLVIGLYRWLPGPFEWAMMKVMKG